MVVRLRYYFVILLLIISPLSWAIDINVSFGLSPDSSEFDILQPKKNKLLKVADSVINAIDEHYSAGSINIKYYPFARSVDNVLKGRSDVHFPMLQIRGVSADKLPFAFVSQSLSRAVFVLYTALDKPILDMENLEKYNLSTQRGHKHLFPFIVSENNNIRQGFEKLLRGRTDGYIVAQGLGDRYIIKHKLSNIRRTFYLYGEAGFIIRKDDDQQLLDDIISNALLELKRSGRLAQLTKTLSSEYVDWKPAEMGW